MALPRSTIVSDEIANWYHIVNRCVRRAHLCGKGFEHRKEMLRKRLIHVSKVFCIEVASYAVMDNHLHIVIRLDPRGAEKLSPTEVAKRWLQANPAHWDWSDENAVPEIDDAKLEAALESPETIEKWRKRLQNMGECLKSLKEPIARRCNKEDDCTGAFWEGRYKSIPLLDQAGLIACMAYVDLNPIRACVATTPEQSDYTSIQDRIDLRQKLEKEHGSRAQTKKPTAVINTVYDTNSTNKANNVHNSERDLWLTPIKACITNDWGIRDNGLKPDDYIELIEATGRSIRDDKPGSINPSLAPILQRLNLDVEAWIACMQTPKQMIGAAIGHLNARIAEASRRSTRWVRNRCPLFADNTSSS